MPLDDSADSKRVELPLDSDIEVEESASGGPKPIHLSWSYLGIVAMGGAAGTATREVLSLAIPAVDGVAWVIVAINVLGALALGTFLETLARRGPDEGRRRTLRLLIGTGVLGGFTTYSTLATTAAQLLSAGRVEVSILYAVVTLVLGAAGTVAGIALGSALHRFRQRSEIAK